MTDAADIERWSEDLVQGEVEVRQEAARHLAQSGIAAQSAAVPLVRAVSDVDEEVAIQASEALENLGPPCAQDLPELIRLLTHDHPDCGYWAATLVGRLGKAGAAAVAGLSEAVRSHPAVAVRERAAWALGEIGPAAAAAQETLLAAIRSDSPRLARLAKESLARIGK